MTFDYWRLKINPHASVFLKLLVEAAERDKVLIILQLHVVLDVLPVLGVLRVSITEIAHLNSM